MSATTTKPRYRTVFIYGVGRSGSTLLGRLLDNHPSVVSVGELLRLERVVDDPEAMCSCGRLASECHEWNSLIAGVPDKVRRDYKKWTPELLDHVRTNAGKEVLVDVSKTRGYRLAKRWKNPEVGYVLLLRDPRGIFRTNVMDKRNLVELLKMHKKWLERFASFAKKRADRCHVMYYEDMVGNPEPTMRALCDFIGIDYHPELISPAAKIHHLATYSVSPYMKGASELRLDERWRTDISPADLALISNHLKSLSLYRDRYRLDQPLP
jgi:hypothetical protein